MSFSIGIVGLPNVGKSTLFQALTKIKVDASNYPFCTIDPNVGVIPVPDERLTALALMSKSDSIIPTTVEFFDIAGLVQGASNGEGLGNKFLDHIRQVDAIVEVVRTFNDPSVIHVHGDVNPESDQRVIQLELILADLDVAQKRKNRAEDQLKGTKDNDALAEYALLTKSVECLTAERALRALDLSEDEKRRIKKYNFLTEKPILYVYNVGESELKKTIATPSHGIIICAKLEAELADVSPEELPQYLSELGLTDTGLNQLIKRSYKLLELVTFFTTGPKETRAWTVHRGGTAQQAAGVIHTDFEKGFIRAEVVGTKDLLEAGSWTEAKNRGKLRMEGKEYLVRDGDVVYFHANM